MWLTLGQTQRIHTLMALPIYSLNHSIYFRKFVLIEMREKLLHYFHCQYRENLTGMLISNLLNWKYINFETLN